MLLEVYKLFGNTEEFWKFVMRNRLKLTEEQFQFAIQGLRTVKDAPTKAAKMVLVDGKDPAKVAVMCKIDPSNLSTKVARILENLTKQLAKHGKSYRSYIIDDDLIVAADALESKSLKGLKVKSKSRKK